MSQLLCPLCGRLVSLRYFDPSRFDDDVYVIEVKGLGRGKGVVVVNRYSILDPNEPVVELIKQRLLVLCRLFVDGKCLGHEEVVSALGIQNVHQDKVSDRDRIIRSMTDEMVSLKQALNDRNEAIDSLNKRIDTLEKNSEDKDDIIDDLTEKVREKEEEVKELAEDIFYEHPSTFSTARN